MSAHSAGPPRDRHSQRQRPRPESPPPPPLPPRSVHGAGVDVERPRLLLALALVARVDGGDERRGPHGRAVLHGGLLVQARQPAAE
eukprot:CAMPEP_0202880612 /NCGR_PEP_ID=MMETSP1391-20130828/35302_1 /ASSEMBLY_ACC=CAM_ASM_000867 /TAXON_ID=1034604 /ORGANISM="Chlamydomonas leiostraca, Strain SAG 11-49" /LENGTH=85 /DNA_ID=CAMNT_0049563141 /DNA_START=257 /DNA_END=511 /DNA_ORIENTATION=+